MHPRTAAMFAATAATIALLVESAYPGSAYRPSALHLDSQGRLAAQPKATPSTASNLHPTKLLSIMEENHSFTQAWAGMPYLRSLGVEYGYATHYVATTHPSLPNYLAIDAGSTFGVTDDGLPTAHPINAPSVFDQAIAAGKTGKTYAESMPGNCHQVNSGNYIVHHSPWPYFTWTASRANCKVDDVPSSRFLRDARNNALPVAGMVTPNLTDDAHDGTLAQADAWLRARLPTLLVSTDFTSGRLAVVVVFDEGTYSDNTVLAVVLDANLHGKVVSTRLNHYSLSRFYSQTIGASPLRRAATAPNMRAAFGL